MDNPTRLVLRTERLELVACTVELARAEAEGAQALAAMLDAALPSMWPPPLNDEQSQRWMREQLERDPALVGWIAWYFLLGEPGGRRLIGNGGFKGAPREGMVETGYSIVPEYQGKGYATEGTRALIAWAFSHPEVNRVAAETLPDMDASLGVLRKCGMKYVGKGAPEEGQETVHYEIERE